MGIGSWTRTTMKAQLAEPLIPKMLPLSLVCWPASDYANLSALSERLPLCFWELLATEEFLQTSDLPQCNPAAERTLLFLLMFHGQPTHQSACWEESQPGWHTPFILLPHLLLNANPAENGVPPEFGKAKSILCWSSKNFELSE